MSRTPSAPKIARYLRRMRDVRAQSTPESSFYGPLQELLREIGAELKPQVEVVGQLRDAGFGIPDFGFCTQEQLQRLRGEDKTPEKPDRGAAEVKGLSADIGALLQSRQAAKYARGYGVVLASNCREFALAEMRAGKVVEIDRRRIAASEEEFWEMAAHPQKSAAACADAVCEFLSRALSHNAPITSAEDLAVELASFAREMPAAMEQSGDESAIAALRGALESALNMTFEGEKGGRFFRSTLAQTIVYGMFAAWIAADDKKPFDWRAAGFSLKSPVMRALFSEIVNPDRLGRLGLQKSLDGAAAALDRVEEKNGLFADAAAAIQYFYEPFLAEFDPELRKEMGVWYTPPEIVQYMVERADRVLRDDLGIAAGFADDSVYVLDPCGGTGAYIAEVLRRICKTCKERGDGGLAAAEVKRAAQKRVVGFEILSSSYVIAHWQIGALLSSLGAPLQNGERAAIYLTNSLTNWTPAEMPPLPFPGLREERDAANAVKQKQPILVILGNPPYNAFAGASPKEEEGLVAPYKKDLRKKWGVRSGNLNDLYVRFFAMAQNRIAKTGRGVVSFISNYSYTEEPLFVVMRESLLKSFGAIWIDSLNGDRRATGKKTPDGLPDPSVFSTPINRAGIQVGTAIGMFVRDGRRRGRKVRFRNFWGTRKREELLESLDCANFNSQYETAKPNRANRFSFRSLNVSRGYLRCPSLAELCESSFNGMEEARGGEALRNIDRAALEKGMRDYFNPGMSWDDFCRTGHGLSIDTKTFSARAAREKILQCRQTREFKAESVLPYTMRLFDDGFCYYTPLPRIWHRAMAELRAHYKRGNSFIVSRAKDAMTPEGAPAFFTRSLGDRTVMASARYIPVRLYEPDPLNGDFVSANLSKRARQYLRELNFADPDKDAEAAEILWLHSLAVCYSPLYQAENADGLRIDWPRVPLPSSADVLRRSAALGAKTRALLDMQTPVDWRSPEHARLTPLAQFCGDPGDLAVSDRWGYKDGKGKVYPGRGKIEARQQTPEYAPFAGELGAPLAVFLHDGARWECVPERVWEYRIGGFQPPKKWLSYRAARVLNRPLRSDEVRVFADIVRRIAALVLSEPKLDENYRALRG